jgi:hypothetical protein
MLVCEATELTQDGHYYRYRYNGQEGRFYRATVPSGAASVHFRVLEPTDKVPLGGWQLLEVSTFSKKDLQLVTKHQQRSVHSSSNKPRERPPGDGRR